MADRFWSKVDKQGPDECWEWKAYRTPGGYGRYQGRQASRMALKFSGADVPEDAMVCHHCDNPPCCNPAHLYVGDALTNARDRNERGRTRGAAGTRNRHNKLTPEQVAEIRRTCPNGRFRRGERAAIADRYGVTGMTIHHIVTGKTWKGSEVGVG